MALEGWVKDYRKELESDIWKMSPLYHRVWQYLKYKANHSENIIPLEDGTDLVILPGQHLTSLRKICEGVKYHENGKKVIPCTKTIRKILKWLEKKKMITIDNGKGGKQYTLITIVNWGFYQNNDDRENTLTYTPSLNTFLTEETFDSLSSKQSIPINNNDKECLNNEVECINNEKENTSSLRIASTIKNLDIDVQKIFDYYKEQFWGLYTKINLTQKRKGLIKERLLNGFTVEDIITAIDNIRQSDFHCKDNPNNMLYATLEFICKNNETLEQWINNSPTHYSKLSKNVKTALSLVEKYSDDMEGDHEC